MAKDTTKLLSVSELHKKLLAHGLTYYCGVPDTILSPFGLYLEEHAPDSHAVAANEGNAVALAIGHYLATSQVPLVYMQNSGLGNAINPLLSLADQKVMSVPLILLIGWRGRPGTKDEPQHQAQGGITTALLDAMAIPHVVLAADPTRASSQIQRAVQDSRHSRTPYAILVGTDTLEPYARASVTGSTYTLTRETAIEHIIASTSSSDAIIATTGKTGREIYELRNDRYMSDHAKDLLVVGGMGHASSIAAGIAKQAPDHRVVCIDGDGAVLMHMGAMATIGTSKLKNLSHIVINNGAHESVGGQRTVAYDIDLPHIAKGCGYDHVFSVSDTAELSTKLDEIDQLQGLVFLEIRVNTDSRKDLGRPTISPRQNKDEFMAFIGSSRL